MRHDGIGEATIAINVKFSNTTIVLNVNSYKSSISLYLGLFQIFCTKFIKIEHTGLKPKVESNRPHPCVEQYLSVAKMHCTVLTSTQYLIWRTQLTRRNRNNVFLCDFRLNKPVKFSSGQYMNNTWEGGPWAPFYRAV